MSLNAFVALDRLVPALVAHRAALPVMVVLAGAADDDGLSWCSLATLSKRAGQPLTTIKRHLAALEAAGLLRNLEAADVPDGLPRRGDSRVRQVAVVRHPWAAATPIEGPSGSPSSGLAGSPSSGPRTRGLKRGVAHPAGHQVAHPMGQGVAHPAGHESAKESAKEPRTPDAAGLNVSREAQPAPPSKADQDAADAWAMWEGFITAGGGTVVTTERVIITDTVERFGLERTQSAIASLIDCRKRPPVGWVRDRASKAHGQEQVGRQQATPTHRRAGLPTATDKAAAQVDEAAEIARLEADAAAQRARIEAVAPRPNAAPSPAVAPEPVASPEKMRELAAAVSGIFGGKR